MNKQKADEIITSYLTKIYGFAVRKTFSYDEAEELSSQIAVELYESLLKAEEIFNLDGYVWRISEHVYAKYVSSVKRRQGISLDGIDIPFEDTYDLGETEEEMLRLRREITYLTKARREIVYAYYYENKSISRIAAERGIPEGTVKWHLSKARDEIRKGIDMERKIGRLGMNPIVAEDISHCGDPGPEGGPEFYIGDSLNLNIVYSVYHTPRTKEEIAEELGITPVFIEEKIKLLEDNGFLVRQAGGKFTTYVCFSTETYSLERRESFIKKQLEAAEILAKDYARSVIDSMAGVSDVYIPGGNRELPQAAAVFYGVTGKCALSINKDMSRYTIKTTQGGSYIAFVELSQTQSDKDYVPTLNLPSMWGCGSMARTSGKYPVYSWSIDSRYSSREGSWKNNLTEDYEYLYEVMNGSITEDRVNLHKFNRLREREYLSEDNKVNIMVINGDANAFFDRIPSLDEATKRKFADFALENAELIARDYPPQMHDLVIKENVCGFIGRTVALMVMDILYGNGTFRKLTDREKITSNLIMFCDTLPKE